MEPKSTSTKRRRRGKEGKSLLPYQTGNPPLPIPRSSLLRRALEPFKNERSNRTSIIGKFVGEGKFSAYSHDKQSTSLRENMITRKRGGKLCRRNSLREGKRNSNQRPSTPKERMGSTLELSGGKGPETFRTLEKLLGEGEN